MLAPISTRAGLLLSCLALAACTPKLRDGLLPGTGAVDDAGAGAAASDAGPDAGASDRDQDGVCDATELRVGTNPDALDSDDDGLPDAIELINAFDPLNPSSPELDQLGFMPARRDASYEFDVRATVDGAGEDFTGSLGSYPSFDDQMRVAEDFFVGASAFDAEPAENVLAIDAQAERFEGVVGHTRLSFRVRFAYPSDEDFPCSAGFSFAYQLKTDQGAHEGSRDYMLVITPKDSTGREAKDFCLPAACL